MSEGGGKGEGGVQLPTPLGTRQPKKVTKNRVHPRQVFHLNGANFLDDPTHVNSPDLEGKKHRLSVKSV